MPAISIILPLYRVKDYLPEAIASVKAQTFTDWECLCLDDGSGNGMADFARALTADDPRFSVREFPNAGVATTRNRGLDLAQGDFVAFLDQDDAYHPTFLARLHAAITEAGADCAMCRFQSTPLPEAAPEAPAQVVDDPLDWLFGQSPMSVSVWTKLWRKASLGGLRFDATLFGSDDALFAFAAFARFRRLAVLDAPLYFYRRHAAAVSVQVPKRYLFACLRVLRKLPAVMPERYAGQLRRRQLKGLADLVKGVSRGDYPLPLRRAIALNVLALLRRNGLSTRGWSWGKRLRWWRFLLRAHLFFPKPHTRRPRP